MLNAMQVALDKCIYQMHSGLITNMHGLNAYFDLIGSFNNVKLSQTPPSGDLLL